MDDGIARDVVRLGRLLFLDFEAERSIDGRTLVPVEVGVANALGRASSVFIRPAPEWPAVDHSKAWSGRIRREDVSNGMPVDEVRRVLARRFENRFVVSDACFVDQPLLDMVMESTDVKLISFFPLLESIKAEHRGLTDAVVNAWIVDIDAARGNAHSAGEDARVRGALIGRVLSFLSSGS